MHESLADAFLARLKAAVVKMYDADPKQGPDCARMISAHDTERVASYILPGQVVDDGHDDIDARLVEPAILYPSGRDRPALQQEVVGPVLPYHSFGGGCVNQTNLHCWIDSLPFGGVGYSGMGRHYGQAGFDALSNTKAMLIGNPDLELDASTPYAGKDIAQNLSVFS